VAFLGQKGSGLLAYGVGVGKTLAGIMATVQSMQRGWCKRPLVVVPKSVAPNWRKNFEAAFPGVPVNYLGNMGSDLKGREPRIKDGEVSIVTYDGFNKMAFHPETVETLTKDIQDATSAFPAAGEDTERKWAQRRQKAKEKVGKAQKGGEYNFEDLGFDHCTVDEIHNFKNIFGRAKIKDEREDRGTHNEFHTVQGGESARGAKLWLLAQHIQKHNGGRGLYGLSATPFTNSPTEIYNIISLMARDRLHKMGIFNINDFISSYASLQTEDVIKGNGKIVEADVIKEFQNLPELQRLVKEFIDFRSGEEVGVKRPKKEEHVVELEPTAEQARIFDEAEKEYDKASKANPAARLKAINKQRNATLSPKLVTGKGHFVRDSPKLKYTFDMVSRVFNEKPGTGQIVYLPRGNQYFPEAVDYLVKNSDLKHDQIGIIDGKVSGEKRQKILDDFNRKDGKIKVLIGSAAIKEGVNAQKNCPILYNTFMDWNPTDVEQVRGRIWRQNNPFETAHIVYPVLLNSIDALMYQKHDEKLKRQQNIWSYKGYSIDVSDIDPEEMKFEVIKDPGRRAAYRIDKEKQSYRSRLADEKARLGRLLRVRDGGRKGYNVEHLGLSALEERFKQTSASVEWYESQIKEKAQKVASYKKRKKKATLSVYELSEMRRNEREVADYKLQMRPVRQRLKEVALYKERHLNLLKNLKVPAEKLSDEIERLEQKVEETKEKIKEIEDRRDAYIEEARKEIIAQAKVVPDVDESVKRDSNAILSNLKIIVKSKAGSMGMNGNEKPGYRSRIRRGLKRNTRTFAKSTNRQPTSDETGYRRLIRHFLKRKALPVGHISVHGGKQVQKQADGSWKPVGSGGPGKKRQRLSIKKLRNPYPRKHSRTVLPDTPPRPNPDLPFVDNLPGLPEDSLTAHTGPDGKLIRERDDLHREIMRHHMRQAMPVDYPGKPRAIMMMGGPASGKSTMVRHSGLSTENFVVADADGVKDYLPEYRVAVRNNARSAATVVHEESSMLVKAIRSEAIDTSRNLVIDGTGSKIASYETNLARLVEQGFHTTLLMADCGADLAVRRAADRAERTGRFIPESFIRDSYGGIPANFVGFRHKVDEFSVYDTGREPAKLVWSKKDGKETVHDSKWMEGFLERAGNKGQEVKNMEKSNMSDDKSDERKPQHTLDQIQSMIEKGFAAEAKADKAAKREFPADDGIRDVPYELED
jgi:predicted ABC-type ATPase